VDGKKLAVVAAIAVSIIVAGVLVAGSGILAGPEGPVNMSPGSADGPRNFVVNVTDSINLEDK
jgi:hypothetical protein